MELSAKSGKACSASKGGEGAVITDDSSLPTHLDHTKNVVTQIASFTCL